MQKDTAGHKNLGVYKNTNKYVLNETIMYVIARVILHDQCAKKVYFLYFQILW